MKSYWHFFILLTIFIPHATHTTETKKPLAPIVTIALNPHPTPGGPKRAVFTLQEIEQDAYLNATYECVKKDMKAWLKRPAKNTDHFLLVFLKGIQLPGCKHTFNFSSFIPADHKETDATIPYTLNNKPFWGGTTSIPVEFESTYAQERDAELAAYHKRVGTPATALAHTPTKCTCHIPCQYCEKIEQESRAMRYLEHLRSMGHYHEYNKRIANLHANKEKELKPEEHYY